MDLKEALNAAEIDYHNGSNEDEIWLCCPWCEDERFRLGVNVVTGATHCFNCDEKAYGDYAFSKLQEALDTGDVEAKQEKRRKKKKRMEKLVLPDEFVAFAEHNGYEKDHWYNKARSFVRKRGVSSDQIEEKKIGYTLADPFAYRIIFPVYLSGILVGLVGRTFVDNVEPKYKNSIGAKCLYNLPEKKHSSVVLSEGVFDALVIERAAKKLSMDSVGLLGHSISDEQLKLLHHYKRIYVWLDPDKAGIEGLISIRNKIPSDRHLKVILPKGMLEGNGFDKRDPSEMDIEEISKRLERAESFTEELKLKLKTWQVYDE